MKQLNKLKKYFPYIFLIIIFLLWNLVIYPIDTKEIMNYGFAHNIYSGLVPYIDFNMNTTPLYPMLMSVLFYPFGSNILVFHISHLIILIAICILLFKFLKENAWFVILLFFLPFPNLIPNYTWLLLLFYLILLYLENQEKTDVLIGIIIGLTILTKQNLGLFLILPSILYIKKPKKIIKRIIGIIMPILLFYIYTVITGSSSTFISLYFKDFTIGNIFNIYGLILLIIILYTIKIITKHKSDIENYYTLAFYSIIMPYFDFEHLKYCLIAFLIILFLNRTEEKNKKTKFSQRFFVMSIIACITVLGSIMFIKPGKYPNDIKHFEYRFIPKDKLYETKVLNNYIKKNKGTEFIFLTPNSYYFKLANNLKINQYDLLDKDIIETEDIKALLNTIESNKSAIYVIDRENQDKEYYKTAIKLLKSKAKKMKTVGVYDIYVF